MTVRVSKVSEKVNSSRVVNGVIVVNEKNPVYGSIMFEEVAFTNANGFLNKQKRVAFLRSDIETLKEYVSSLGLKAGSPVEGKIVIAESTTPSYEGQAPKINPTSGEIITHNGDPIYRTSSLGSGLDSDTLLESDKVEVEIVSEKKVLESMSI